jgi:diadenosine tetraphosphate (Ap4A) HIT family hydrolase
VGALSTDCPFCALPDNEILYQHGEAVVRRDKFPLAKGHSLIIPRRHVGSFFDLTDEERSDMMEVLLYCRAAMKIATGVTDFTIGINDGPAAGQTVPHCHMHLIPRRLGDVPNPRGGIRRIFPNDEYSNG